MYNSQIQIVPDLCWSEKELPQRERTKHVHSIHQYMGKYVPQLVSYYLERDLKNCNFLLDPFVGSGTTLVEANIHGIPSFGIDTSEFNTMLSNVKIKEYNISKLREEISDICVKTENRVLPKLSSKSHRKKSLTQSTYLKTWYVQSALQTLLTYRRMIKNYKHQDVLKIILSRAARSSRLVPHFEVDFPKKPQTEDYFCYKHSRICHPTTNALHFIKRYCKDVLNRLDEFQNIRNDVYTKAVCADSRVYKFPKNISSVDGIITSPPYVGLLDYHEQHRYAYELLNIKDRSPTEIGTKRNGSSQKAILSYKKNITKVFKNIADSILDKNNGVVVIIVNDKLNLYDDIMNDAGLGISRRFKREVNRRSGRRQSSFYEDIIIWDAHNH